MLLSVRSFVKNLSGILNGIPGRKMVVLFSSGFALDYTTRLELRDAVSDCNKANVAVYTVDLRALLVTPPGGSSQLQPREEDMRAVAVRSERMNIYRGARLVLASYGVGMLEPQRPGSGSGGTGGGGTDGGTGGKGGSGGTGGTGGSVPNTNPSNPLATRTQPTTILPSLPPSVSTNQQLLATLAEGTGGFTIFNTNDLLGGLEKIGREQNEFYILGYVPQQTIRRFQSEGQSKSARGDEH